MLTENLLEEVLVFWDGISYSGIESLVEMKEEMIYLARRSSGKGRDSLRRKKNVMEEKEKWKGEYSARLSIHLHVVFVDDLNKDCMIITDGSCDSVTCFMRSLDI
ncbi:hypothetical protein CDAR_381521 [Caerostris darwini]|uniref:Uncharacterized protein n=1 Tax=Caerostris darwini TaxID=1538125 RepID=A0AAV4V506_9ARAC|nr:hypothetical protein CDAR_381521 [Caerostris darwini]